MRLAKFSDEDPEFPDLPSLNDYFHRKIRQRSPAGQIFVTGRVIAKNGLREGEIVLFSYKGLIRFVARVASGRQNNTSKDKDKRKYPYFFTVDLRSIREIKPIGYADLVKKFADAGISRKFKGHGWNTYPDSKSADAVVDGLP